MMNLPQQIIIIGLVVIGTMATRFIPFLIFPPSKKTPEYIKYLGAVLPSAVFALLVIYCLRDISFLSDSYGIPETLAILVIIVLHVFKRQMLLSIAGGTIIYMLLIQYIFV